MSLDKEMLAWLQEEEKRGVDEYRDVDLYITGWAKQVADLLEKQRIMLGLIGGHVNLDDEMHEYLFNDE